MLSQNTIGYLVFAGIVVALFGGLLAALTGTFIVFRITVLLAGIGLAVGAAVLLAAIANDSFARYQCPATVLSASRGARYVPAEGSAKVGEQYALDVEFTFVAKGAARTGHRYAPVELFIEDSKLDGLIQRLTAGGAVAYVSYFDPNDAVLDRALGARAGAAVVMSIFAVLLLLVGVRWKIGGG